MKKTLISIVAVAFVALMISNAYANCGVPKPPCTCGRCPGLTLGFWKHNIQVYLDGDSIGYSALPDGTKLTNALMDTYLTKIQGKPGMAGFTFEDALAYLKLKGWSADRTNTANWFNWAAGYGPFKD
jgi:hypothetical protein